MDISIKSPTTKNATTINSRKRRRKICRTIPLVFICIIASMLANLLFTGFVGVMLGNENLNQDNNDNKNNKNHHYPINEEQKNSGGGGGLYQNIPILRTRNKNKRFFNHDRYRQQTLPPRESSMNSAGFVHIGKTGGSTISTMLRNGCNSLKSLTSTCRNITNETAISKFVEHYYHVPDFWRLPTSNHSVYIISVRDVYDRTVSSFLYHHPENAQAYNMTQTNRQKVFGPMAYKCFPTVEILASLMDGLGNSTNCNYPYAHNELNTENCQGLACATLHGKVRFFSHLFFNYRNILDTKLTFLNQTSTSTPPRIIYVIRQEFFWNDWITVNRLLGQQGPIQTSTIEIQRNISGKKLPVTRTISDHGRLALCKAMETEYNAYFRLLKRAINIQGADLENCIQIALTNCPNLPIRNMALSIGM